MFYKTIIAIVFTAFSSTLAITANLIPVDELVVVDDARFDWSGGYVGASAGKAKGNFVHQVDNSSARADGDLSGASYGVIYAGYNWQMNNLVFGVEGDWNWLNIDGTTPTTVVATLGVTDFKSTTSVSRSKKPSSRKACVFGIRLNA
ncbi:MAG: hypothetical protein GY761_11855 [Hyphomicrobiales bacterium]|nr:hypothetical protein [Hyphomicrobiales bacterium]